MIVASGMRDKIPLNSGDYEQVDSHFCRANGGFAAAALKVSGCRKDKSTKGAKEAGEVIKVYKGLQDSDHDFPLSVYGEGARGLDVAP